MLQKVASIRKSIDIINNYSRNPLYRNSLYITLGRFVDVGFGFIFWALAARLYSIGDVGIATALISSLGLILSFSRLGFDKAIIRFMPIQDQNRVFNTCLWITTGATIAVSLIYLSAIDVLASEMTFIREYALLFIIFTIAYSVIDTTGNALLSFRKSDLKLYLNLFNGIRLPLLIPLVFLGSLGIFFSAGFANIVSAIIGILFIKKFVSLAPRIDSGFIRTTFQFSSLNYLSSLLNGLPALVMPILIMNLLSPENAALYYIASSIGGLVLIIPEAISISFFIEGSHGINLRKGVLMTLTATYAALIPAVLLIVLFGDILLSFFGKEYVQALTLLQIISISSVFVVIFNLFIPLQNIRFQVKGIVIINLIKFVLLIGLSYILINYFGIVGAGIAWMVSYMVLSGGIAIYAKMRRWV